MPPASVIPIAVAVVEHEGRVLIGRRPPGVPLAGLWEFPGGKLVPGEDPEEAARRECLEETGVHVRITGTYCPVEHQYKHGRVGIQFFAATPVDPRQEPTAPFRWVRVSELASYEFPAANAHVIRQLVRDGRPEVT